MSPLTHFFTLVSFTLKFKTNINHTYSLRDLLLVVDEVVEVVGSELPFATLGGGTCSSLRRCLLILLVVIGFLLLLVGSFFLLMLSSHAFFFFGGDW